MYPIEYIWDKIKGIIQIKIRNTSLLKCHDDNLE